MLIARSLVPVLAIVLPSCYPTIASAPSQTPLPTPTMSTQTHPLIQTVTLLAKEARRPPLGVPHDPNRPIGFASVFLRLSNPDLQERVVQVQRVEIRSQQDQTLQPFHQESKQIRLKPLENSEVVFHLTNQTGYQGQGGVKAIVTYQVGHQTRTVASAVVEVDRQ